MGKIECELISAVRTLANLKSSDNSYSPTQQTFDIANYTASIVLYEQSDRTTAALAGGLFKNSPVQTDYREFAGGAGGIPGISIQNSSSQQIQGKRLLAFKQILSKEGGKPPSYSFPRSAFYDACDRNGPGSNPSNDGMALGADLGIAGRLKSALDDARDNPAIVEEEVLTFNFVAEIDAGGTVSIVKLLSQGSIGAGIKRSLTENVKITIVRDSKS
ncbi:hypothetical protein X744_22500 [Mesorhizobium sp. LNJC372A00]|nr:hypothetical protein X745_20875 [Mesorhizobium sp. LNJC374B00]ESY55995.1 hypothetical protein X744_22500 [Mesorhizobium sp. LNJC372A00]